MLRVFFVLLQIVLIVFCAAVLKEKTEFKCFERIGRSIVYVTLTNVFMSMILAIIGYYSMVRLIIVNILFVIALFILISNKKQIWKLAWCESREILTHKCFLLIIAIAAILYFFFPTNYMLGGRDPGLYYLNGIHIVQSGGYQYEEDEFLIQNEEALSEIITPGYPGLYSDYEYGFSENFGEITPQFMPMFPSAMAIGYDLGGIALMIRVNGYLTILSFFIIYFFLSNFFSKKTANVAILLLTLSPAQLWYGRNSVSEILLQLIIFLSVDLYARGFEERKRKNSIIAGFLLGLGIMDRIDAYFLGIGLIAILLYSILFSKKRSEYAFYSVLTYCIIAGLGFLYGIIWSKPYFYDHMKNVGSLTKVLLLNLVLIIVTIITYAVLQIGGCYKNRQIPNYVFKLFHNRTASIIFGICLLLLWVYAYFIRSYGMTVDNKTYFIKHNICELSWYVSPIIMLLTIIGFVVLLYKNVEKYEAIFLFLAIGISNYIGYGINPYISKDHIWASRRWVTIIIPFLIIMGTLGIQFVYRALAEKKKSIAIICCVCLLGGSVSYLLYHDKDFLTTRIMDNLDTQVEGLAAQLEDDTLYITNNEEIASYLRYVYNKRVYLSKLEKDNIEQYIEKNDEIMYIGNYASIADLECNKELVSFFETRGLFLEKTIGVYPKNLYERTREASIYRLSANDANY